jgi:molybdopterin-guanine dinucleotide biosynthesis protein A
MSEYGAVVLAGGAARRLGGADKPGLLVGGAPLLTRVLDAVADADPMVVVGPPHLGALLPVGARLTCEEPPGGGPAVAAAAGWSLITGTDVVALLAADLPFLTPAVLAELRARRMAADADGAVLVDPDDRPQWMAGVWRFSSLADRLARAQPGDSLRATVSGLSIVTLGVTGREWFDCDTFEDLTTARSWSHADAG